MMAIDEMKRAGKMRVAGRVPESNRGNSELK